MEKIINLALNRFKKHWLSYFLIYLLSILAAAALVVLIILAAGLTFGLYWLLGQNTIVAVVLATLFIITSLTAFSYLGSLFNLAKTLVLVEKDHQEINAVLKTAKPLAWPFLVFNVLFNLFIFGLLYTGVFLFIPLILWMVWSSFRVFAFLDNHRGGLKPLWYSRAKVSQNFWKVFLYSLVLFVALMVIMVCLGQLNQEYQFVNTLAVFLFTPFAISFSYELYHSLPEPTELKPAKIWIGLSVVGYLIMAAIFFFLAENFSQELLKQIPLGDRGNIMQQEIPGIHKQSWQEN